MQLWKISSLFLIPKRKSIFSTHHAVISMVPEFSGLYSFHENKKKQLDDATGDAVFNALFCCCFHLLAKKPSGVLHHAILEGYHKSKSTVFYLTVRVPL